ncbi:MAG: YdcF family protein, partial [Pseudomonadota bacterium]
ALIRAIDRYLLVSTPLARSDLGLLFGGRRSAAARVAVATDLWHRGLLDGIIVSGGPTGGDPVTEAETMAALLVADGVPDDQILLETRATNTGENVRFSIDVLKRAGVYDRVRSVTCIGRFSTSRRYLMTLERHWPEIDKRLAVATYHDVDRALWHTHPDLAAEVLVEWRKLRPYLRAGFLHDLDPRTCPLLAR